MSGERVLVVEDNEDNLNLVRFLLEQAGYGVQVARDGRTGLELAQQQVPDLILLDMSIPEVDGWKVAGQLKGDSAHGSYLYCRSYCSYSPWRSQESPRCWLRRLYFQAAGYSQFCFTGDSLPGKTLSTSQIERNGISPVLNQRRGWVA